jgi:2-phospho-L-lactate transferase/gluconeogenesis factor (CofD/UPF0052 family)
MSQPGETTDFRASDHVAAIANHAGGAGLLDFAVVSNSRVSASMRRIYAEQNAAPVENDILELQGLGLEVIEADLLLKRAKVRHNPAAVGAVAFDLALRGRQRRLSLPEKL